MCVPAVRLAPWCFSMVYIAPKNKKHAGPLMVRAYLFNRATRRSGCIPTLREGLGWVMSLWFFFSAPERSAMPLATKGTQEMNDN